MRLTSAPRQKARLKLKTKLMQPPLPQTKVMGKPPPQLQQIFPVHETDAAVQQHVHRPAVFPVHRPLTTKVVKASLFLTSVCRWEGNMRNESDAS